MPCKQQSRNTIKNFRLNLSIPLSSNSRRKATAKVEEIPSVCWNYRQKPKDATFIADSVLDFPLIQVSSEKLHDKE